MEFNVIGVPLLKIIFLRFCNVCTVVVHVTVGMLHMWPPCYLSYVLNEWESRGRHSNQTTRWPLDHQAVTCLQDNLTGSHPRWTPPLPKQTMACGHYICFVTLCNDHNFRFYHEKSWLSRIRTFIHNQNKNKLFQVLSKIITKKTSRFAFSGMKRAP